MRCFVALETSEEVKETLSQVIRGAKSLGVDASFVKPDQLHITMAFLGEISGEEAEEKAANLEELDFPSFDLEIKGLGFFPDDNYIKVFWAGCKSESLKALQKRVAELVESREEREFTEHLTLARIRSARNADSLKAFKKKHEGDSFGTFRADTVTFKKSTLTPNGPVYEDLAVISLK